MYLTIIDKKKLPNLYLSRWHGCLCEVDDDMMLGYILSLTYNHCQSQPSNSDYGH